MPGKRVTIVRVTYGPARLTRPQWHAGSVTASITRGGPFAAWARPLETFTLGQSFFEPPGAIHLVRANASNTELAEMIAVFVADEGAERSTYID